MIIDMQEAMRPVIWRFEELANRIAGLVQKAREQGVPVIAVQQTGPPGTPFDPEAAGWQLSTKIGTLESDLRVSQTAETDPLRCAADDVPGPVEERPQHRAP
ncbi:MAG: isochorismatase family protein [Actinomycetota bacterium]|nr:isochorismatase family protein [Actinomycetota bacterium]